MKKRILLVIFLITAAAVAGTLTRSAREDKVADSGASQGKEMRESYQLEPGAQVRVSGINGAVEIETADTNTAEVFVERHAQSQEELDRRKIVIEHTPTSLIVRSEQTNHFNFWSWWGHNNSSERVVLKVPRQIALTTNGINGKVSIGEVAGTIEVHGVNGKVELSQASEYTEIKGVNGPVQLSINQLGERGLRMSGINGSIELRLADGLNADFEARGMNGGVRSEIPGVVVQKDGERSKFSGRIGEGGAPLTLSGINGTVRLTRPSA